MTARGSLRFGEGTARLEVTDARLSFGGVTALDAVSLIVRPGEVHSVIGPNGAGKSTLINAISRVYPLDAGSVRLDSRDLDGMRVFQVARAGVARTFQKGLEATTETVLDAVMWGMVGSRRSGPIGALLGLPAVRREHDHDRRLAVDLCQRVGLAPFVGQCLDSVPYGVRKLADVARALATRPRLLLLDEPAAGLTDAETATLGELIRELPARFSTTVVLVEHDLSMVRRVSDSVTAMNFGRVIASGTPASVLADAAVKTAYLGAAATAGPGRCDEVPA